MRSLSAAELLTIWEQGSGQPNRHRALLLLAAACPQTSWQQLAQLSLGQRDAQLLSLREQIMGSEIVSVATCPHCGDRLELTLMTDDIRLSAADLPLAVAVAGYQVQFRLPNSEDLAAIADQPDLAIATQHLFQRCLLSVKQLSQPIEAAELPAAVITAILTQMEQADPQADIRLALDCPTCQHQWQVAFDVVTFFWAELNALAQRLLQEVHLLASAYGWHEADILALSPQRRQIYLEMIYG
ncbi:T4 family baseplate hub assembly chaperone [Almyronema epifaneia]|uniref:Phage baseplate protein n=1 Tax=Almyronema epifaneia S1 TaxID=2991925 RepID=A0ABW6IG03_9CYAN